MTPTAPLLAGELTPRAGPRLLTEGRFQGTEHEAALGPVHGRADDPHAGGDVFVADPGIGRQQDLRPFHLRRRVLAAAQQRLQLLALVLAQFDPVPYIHRCLPKLEGTIDESGAGPCLTAAQPDFTPKQGQYLAFIYAYTQVLGRTPAEADLQRHFRVSPPSVHQLFLTLERASLICRQPGVAHSIQLLVQHEHLPILQPHQDQTVESSVQRY